MTLARDYWVSSSEPTERADRQYFDAYHMSLRACASHRALEVPVAVGPHGRRRPPPE